MASGGEDSNYFHCSVCVDGGRDTAARHFCVDCEVYFCGECIKTHKILKALKSHQLNDVEYPDSVTVVCHTTETGSDDVSGLRCTLHDGNLIDTYCVDHDDVCCGACAVVKHRSCTTLPVTSVSKDYKSSQEIQTYRDKVTKNIVQCDHVNEKRKNNREIIEKEKIELIENVDSREESAIARIKELAEVTRHEIRSKYEQEKTDLDKDIDTLKVVKATNKAYVNKLDSSDGDDLFVFVKMNKTVTKDGKMLIETMTNDWVEKHLVFHFDQTLEHCLDKMNSLGQFDIDDDGRDVNEYIATFHSNVNVKHTDEIDSYIIDMCFFDRNSIFVCDHNNNKLKRFSSDMQFKDEILLSGQPGAVCKTDTDQVAVRIWSSKVVHLVSVGDTLQLLSKFTLDDNGHGMAYDADTGEIFACEKNKISNYSKSGQKLKTYDKDTNGQLMFTSCRQIALSKNKQDIYVTDETKGLIVFDRDGNIKTRLVVSGVSDAWPLCLLPGNICLIGGWSSDIIAQIDKKGQQIGNLVTSKDGRTNTHCAVYDRERSRLLVSGYPSFISIYTLSAK